MAPKLMSWLSSIWNNRDVSARRYAGVGKCRETVIEQLRLHPDVESISLDQADPAKFEVTVRGKINTCDVTNLFGSLNAYPDQDAKEEIGRLVRSLTSNRMVSDDNLVVVIRDKDYVDFISKPDREVVCEPVTANLYAVYMADMPDSMSPILGDEVQGKSLSKLRSIALSNVRHWLSKLVVDDAIGPITLYYIEGNAMLSTSLILLDEFWTMAEAKHSNDLLFAVPRRDQLFVASAKDPRLVSTVQKLVEVTFADGFNLLSDRIYRRRNGQLEMVVDA